MFQMEHLPGRRKTVHVRAYTRIRFFRREHVCAHWRSLPRQYELPF